VERPKGPAAPSKPTLDTHYIIDEDWWQREGRDFDLTITRLCDELGFEVPQDEDLTEVLDYVDMETGEVIAARRLLYYVMTYCATHEEYITERTSLIDAIFRALLAVGNRPLSVRELAEHTGRDSERIIRTLSGQRIYKGIRVAN
jgi:hypothetical protein